MKDSIESFADAKASDLLKKLGRNIRRAAKNPGEKRIHDLRVSIRRLSQCLVEFRQFFPARKTKKRLKRLDALMDLAAEIRNRDIAAELIGAANPKLAASLKREGAQAKRKLEKTLEHWRRRDLS